MADDEFHFLDADTGKELAKYRPGGRVSSDFALNKAGDVLAARRDYSGPRSEFCFTDPMTGKKIDGLSAPDDCHWVAFAPDGKALLVGNKSGVRWWDPAAGKLIRKFDGLASESYSLQRTPGRFTPDGKVLVAHNGYVLLRWDAATGKPLSPGQDVGHGGYVNGVGVSPDGKRIATRGMDGRLCAWDAATGKELWHAPTQWTNSPGIDFAPDGTFLCAGGPEWGEVTKYDAATGKPLRKFTTDPKEPKQASVACVRVTKDGKTVFGLSGPYAVSDPCLVTAWDAATGKRLKTTRLPFRGAYGGELSPRAVFVATGAFAGGGLVEVAAPEKNLLEAAKLPGVSMLPGCFSDDGKWLLQVRTEATGGGKYSAVVVSTVNWGVACTVPLGNFGRAALSPDGRTLVVAYGEELEFYDIITSRGLGGYRVPAGGWEKGHSRLVEALRFTPDGKNLITGLADTTALVWPVPQPLGK